MRVSWCWGGSKLKACSFIAQVCQYTQTDTVTQQMQNCRSQEAKAAHVFQVDLSVQVLVKGDLLEEQLEQLIELLPPKT